jgi:hypothetical protein
MRLVFRGKERVAPIEQDNTGYHPEGPNVCKTCISRPLSLASEMIKN